MNTKCGSAQTKGIIYLAKNNVNGKLYVGMTTRQLKKRISEHKYDSHHRLKGRKSHFHCAINKYGFENFSFYPICEIECEDRDSLVSQLAKLEQYYIALYKTSDKSVGYNLTLGGEGINGYRYSDEDKARMSLSRKGRKLSEETKRRIGEFMRSDKNPNIGKKHSEETKRKISIANKGRFAGKNNPMYGKKRPDLSERNLNSGMEVYQIDLTSGEVIKKWNSLREISRETGYVRSCIADCCYHRTQKSYGYKWEFSKNIKDKEIKG